jgi:hypothetical protein
MTDPYLTGTFIYVSAPTTMKGHRLVTDAPLTLLPGNPGPAARLHTDPVTGITTSVLVASDDGTTSGWLAPNPDRCPLCAGHGQITVREGTLPRDKHGDISLPLELLDTCLRGEKPEPVHDDVIDVAKPCPLCRSIDYSMQADDELGGI